MKRKIKNPRFEINLPNVPSVYRDNFKFPLIPEIKYDLPEAFFQYGKYQNLPLHCFTDDWRIEAIWRSKYKMIEKLVLSNWAIAPDYTIEKNDALAYAFYQVWRSRVVARYWADHQINVIPVLKFARTSINPFLYEGLYKCRYIAVRCPTKDNETWWIKQAEQFIKLCKPQTVLHFGTKRGYDVWPNAIQYKLHPRKTS